MKWMQLIKVTLKPRYVSCSVILFNGKVRKYDLYIKKEKKTLLFCVRDLKINKI